jgi:hypothetical protein
MKKEEKTIEKKAEIVCYYLVGILVFLMIVGAIKL